MHSLRPVVAALLLRAATAQVSQAADWLVAPLAAAAPSTLDESVPGLITLSNGLLSRTFAIAPCFATVDLELHSPPTKLFRGLSPEASLTLNGTATDIGGCGGQTYFDFFDREALNLTQPPAAFRYLSHATSQPTAPYPWRAGQRHSPPGVAWPPKGLHLAVTLGPPQSGAPFNGTAFSQFPGMGFPCDPSCLTGFPSCDNTTLPGQCAWGSQAEALQECAKWGACLGVNCHLAYPYCTARGGPVALFAIGDYVSYVRTNASLYPFGDTTVIVHYEIYDGLPALRKWVEVRQGAASPALVVDDLVIEQFRAPNFVPEQMSVLLIQPNNPTPADDQVVPSPSQSFPGRTQQLWYTDPLWDQGGDAELHVPYSYYTRLSVGYDGAGPGAVLAPGAAFESVSVRLIYHDSGAWERKGLGVRRVQAALAPQMLDNPTRYMITDIASNASFQLAIDQAAAAGFELVIVGYGAAGYCGMCPGQLNDPQWVAWFKSNVDYARAKGVAVSAYTLMQVRAGGAPAPSLAPSSLTPPLTRPPPLGPPSPQKLRARARTLRSTMAGARACRQQSRCSMPTARAAALRALPLPGTPPTAPRCWPLCRQWGWRAWRRTGSTRAPCATTLAGTTRTMASAAPGTRRRPPLPASTRPSRAWTCTRRGPTPTALAAQMPGMRLTLTPGSTCPACGTGCRWGGTTCLTRPPRASRPPACTQ